jgi:hypothetical protein
VSRWFNNFSHVGGTFPLPRRCNCEIGISQQQQIAPVFPPHLRKFGGASRASRRTNCHKILNTAAVLVLPALNLGGSFPTA